MAQDTFDTAHERAKLYHLQEFSKISMNSICVESFAVFVGAATVAPDQSSARHRRDEAWAFADAAQRRTHIAEPRPTGQIAAARLRSGAAEMLFVLNLVCSSTPTQAEITQATHIASLRTYSYKIKDFQ
jgi:hypothetical protein